MQRQQQPNLFFTGNLFFRPNNYFAPSRFRGGVSFGWVGCGPMSFASNCCIGPPKKNTSLLLLYGSRIIFRRQTNKNIKI